VLSRFALHPPPPLPSLLRDWRLCSKTTLVDRVLRDCNVAITSDRVMDRNELEKERGITIMSKVTSVIHGEHRINGTLRWAAWHQRRRSTAGARWVLERRAVLGRRSGACDTV